MRTFAIPSGKYAEIAQLVEHNLAKVRVASSSLVFRSKIQNQGHLRMTFILEKELRLTKKYHPTGFNHMSVVLVHKVGFFVLYKKGYNGHFWLVKPHVSC